MAADFGAGEKSDEKRILVDRIGRILAELILPEADFSAGSAFSAAMRFFSLSTALAFLIPVSFVDFNCLHENSPLPFS